MVGIIAGTRPEVIKLAPVAWALHKEGIPFHMFLIQQHHELLDATMNLLFGFEQSLTWIKLEKHPTPFNFASDAFRNLPPYLKGEEIRSIVVQGDTMTAGFAAQIALFLRKPVIHVEAGVRSHTLEEPWPEEGIRRMIDHIARVHFAPTLETFSNLEKEGLSDNHWVGNTVADALFTLKEKTRELPFRGEPYVIVFLHRWENFERTGAFVEDFLRLYKGHVVVVTHPTTVYLQKYSERAHILGPLPYEEFIFLLKQAKAIITDSGGAQEEASLLGIPCLVFRQAPDRPESILAGQACQIEDAEQAVKLLNSSELETMRFPARIYGDGESGPRIARILKKSYPHLLD
ncbi:MAG: UDP-N-acetylglucosamine 2-epimerase [Candidatus Jordarchaeales archaeon]